MPFAIAAAAFVALSVPVAARDHAPGASQSPAIAVIVDHSSAHGTRSGDPAAAPARAVLAPPMQPVPPTATTASSPTPTLAPTETPRPTATPPPSPTAVPATAIPTTAVPPTAAPPTPTAPPKLDADRPILVLDRVHVRPDRPAPGQAFELDVDVENVGDSDALDIRMQWTADAFLPDRGSSEIYRDRIEPGEERDFESGLRVASTTVAGSHPIAITLTWLDAEGEEYSLQTTIGVEVVGNTATRPQVVVIGSRVPGRVAPGVPFTAVFNLRNVGGKDARTVLLVPTAGPLALQGTGQGAPLTLPPGAEGSLTLRLIAAAPGAPGATQQGFELRYDDAEGERYTDGVNIGLSITDDAAFGPLPMIARYDAGGTVHPGEVFDLELEITNVGVAAARSMMLVLGGGTGAGAGAAGSALGVFAPLDRSNRRFIDDLAPGASTTVSQRMVVDGAAKPGVYVLDIGLSYNDVDGEPLSSNEIVTMLVSRRVSLAINPYAVVTQTMVGASLPFAVELINAGAATVSIGNVSVVGGRYMDVESVPRFVGALDQGGADLIEATLNPRAPSEDAEVQVVVEYLDDFNQTQTFTETFVFVIDDVPDFDEGLEETAPPPPERGFFARLLRGLFGLGASPPTEPMQEPSIGPDRPPNGRSSGNVEPAVEERAVP